MKSYLDRIIANLFANLNKPDPFVTRLAITLFNIWQAIIALYASNGDVDFLGVFSLQGYNIIYAYTLALLSLISFLLPISWLTLFVLAVSIIQHTFMSGQAFVGSDYTMVGYHAFIVLISIKCLWLTTLLLTKGQSLSHTTKRAPDNGPI